MSTTISSKPLSRRSFLGSSAAGIAALFIGFKSDGLLAVASNNTTQLNPFVRIDKEGVVTVIIKHFEMGQGTTTGLTTLIAEELDADWNSVRVDFAPADTDQYKNLFWGSQGTGGSSAIANSFIQYRTAGAAARDLLIQAAAKTWGVPAKEISIKEGRLVAGSKQAHFGEMITAAAQLPVPEKPKLKSPEQFRLIGKTDLPRKDNDGKVNGSAIFAIDVKVPNMVYAVVARSPKFGGELASFKSEKAKKVAGFIDAKALPNKAGVVVYGRNTWSALQARDQLEIEWNLSKAEFRNNAEMLEMHREQTKKPEYHIGAELAEKSEADDRIDIEFNFPFLAHAPMEPLNCVIEPTETGVRVHDGCQIPTGTQFAVAQALDLQPHQVEIKTVYAGGSFGRRATPTSDYQVEAALAYRLLGNTPVKLVWSREDDIRGGYYRSMALHTASIGLKEGKIQDWDHRIVTQSIGKGSPFEAFLVHDGIDHTSVEGCSNTLYKIPKMSVGLSDFKSAIPPLWWRSVGHTHTAFAMESLLDIIADKSDKDPIEMRLAMLDRSDKKQARFAGVIEAARDLAKWKKGDKRGFAAHFSFNTWVAVVADITVKESKVHVDKLHFSVDCGIALNPDVIRAQIEGCAGYALGAMAYDEITFDAGEVKQSNFPDYPSLRITAMPEIELVIVPSAEAPSGIGEPGVPPTAPAVANAIFAATGKRVTQLPLTKSGFEIV